jgi:hypothetical protein
VLSTSQVELSALAVLTALTEQPAEVPTMEEEAEEAVAVEDPLL